MAIQGCIVRSGLPSHHPDYALYIGWDKRTEKVIVARERAAFSDSVVLLIPTPELAELLDQYMVLTRGLDEKEAMDFLGRLFTAFKRSYGLSVVEWPDGQPT